MCGTSDLSDPDVRRKCSELFRGWASEYRNTPGLERIAALYKELPRRKKVVTQERSKVLKETENPFGDEDEEEEPKSPPPRHAAADGSSSSSQPSGLIAHARTPSLPGGSQITGQVQSFSSLTGKDKDKDKKKKDSKKGKKQPRKFNLEAEKDAMKVAIAESSIAATDLLNSLQSINREKERISENQVALQRFEACKGLRRKILRYVSVLSCFTWVGEMSEANTDGNRSTTSNQSNG